MADVRKERAVAKAHLTRAATEIERALASEKEKGFPDTCKLLIEDFKKKLHKYNEKQELFELSLDEEEIDNEVNSAADYRAEKLEVFSRINAQYNKKEVSSEIQEVNGDPPSACDSVLDVTLGGNNINLPRLQLPNFNGNILDFQPFWDNFCAVIDSRHDLSDVCKLSYLQSLLRGEAKSCLQGLSLTLANYATAKEILQRRFGRKEKVIETHIQKLLSVSSRRSCSLWQVYDEVQVHVRSLANLGVTGANYGLVLTPIILHQLPAGVRLEWARTSEGKEGDVEHLLAFLFSEIQRQERSSQVDSASSKGGETEVRPKQRPRPSGAALVNAQGFGAGKRKKECVFCGRNHWSDQCPTLEGVRYEQRKEMIRERRLCFKCLSPKHRAVQCSKVCYLCKGPHHCVLHVESRDELPVHRGQSRSGHQEQRVESGNCVTDTSGSTYYSQSNASGRATLMQVVHTAINKKAITVFFDSGSDFSYIRHNTAKKLGLQETGRTRGTISAFGGNFVEQEHGVYPLVLGGVRTTLLSQKTLVQPLYRAPVPLEILAPFSEIPFTERLDRESSVSIDILIGLDFYHEFMLSDRIVSQGLVAQRSKLGWFISGSYPLYGSDHGSRVQASFFAHQLPSEASIRQLWELDAIGILGESQKKPESQVLLNFRQGVRFTGQRYEVGLPWKGESLREQLVNNQLSAQRRLTALDRKLSRDPEVKDRYREVFEDLERRGVIEEVANTPTGKHAIFYLPHRPVVRDQSSSTKVRPVFDASAKGENGVSLNDCMETGPNMTPDLVQILLRFRRWRYALSADIQKAFLQIQLQEQDRDVHRFLLLDGQKVRHMRFNRVTFGNASSPFILNATIKLHLSKFVRDRTIEELETNLYVDDWLTGSESEEELTAMMEKSEKVMAQGGFPLTKWTSNSPKVREELRRSFVDYQDESHCQKVLGLAWSTREDCFQFETKFQVGEMYTKRSLLGLVARQFDPLGLITPFTVSLKILFQEVWRAGFDWDEILPSDFQNQINCWIAGLEEISLWEVPRRLTESAWDKQVTDMRLIVCADASEKAYGTCVYLESTRDDCIQRRLVISKVRVAPLKRVTLPRLELLAALLGARLLRFVLEALELPSDTPYDCLTDSTIALAWIQGDPCRWKQFVRNRVEEIQTLTNPSCWSHCPGDKNPADLLTRGVKASALIKSSSWLNGPDQYDEDIGGDSTDTLVSSSEHGKLRDFEENQSLPVCSVAPTVSTLIDYQRFSSLGKLLKVVGLVLRFVSKLKAVIGRSPSNVEPMDQDWSRAKILIVKDIQNQKYEVEMLDLLQHGKVSRTSPLLHLSPFLDQDGVIRVQGRLEQALGLTYDEKHPMIVPKGHVALLLVRHQHELMKHAGVGTLISALRGQFWIIAVRTLAKRVIRQCVRCQRFDSRPMDQVTAPLPEDRITRSPPYSITGIDHAGPLYCRDTGEKKLYIVLFTCAVTRALHLELVDSLSLADFLLAFRRFVSRRALPNVIYSDNARTFKAAGEVLRARFGKDLVHWKNICPLSPNWGGWWERLVRSVKSALKKSLGKQSVPRVEMETLLPEVEACVNSRPLTYVSDTGNVLTPSHFLIGRGTPLTSVELRNLGQTVDLSARFELEESLSEHFWKVWKDEYLRNLPPLTTKTRKTGTRIEEGYLVLIKDEKRPRMMWAMGKVVKLYKGRDGKVRAVQLRTQNGLLVRSVQHLCLLEDSGDDPMQEGLTENSELERNHTVPPDVGNTDGKTRVSRSGRIVRSRDRLDL